MKDTMETNLPSEETGKVENENATLETAENATESNPDADATAAGSILTKEEILSRLQACVDASADTPRSEIESLKQAYYKARRNEVEDAKKAFLGNGGEEKDFIIPEDREETQLKELLEQYREKRTAALAEEERLKAENYTLKLQLIDQLKALTESQEDFNKLYNIFKEIQQKWKEIKLVPQEYANDLWREYQTYSERFYDIIKINNQYRDYDFKKNLELKTALCETVEKLENEPDAVSAFHQLQKLHQQWREIGPVAKDMREALWARFKAASTVINKRHQQHFEEQKVREQENLVAKTAICEAIENIDFSTLVNYKDWDEKSKEVFALQEKWKTIGYAPKKSNIKVFDRFRAACDVFFEKKNDFYRQVRDNMEHNQAKKEALCERAEALKDSTDWKSTTEKFIALQKEWKATGPVPRRFTEPLWKRFISACDYFFAQKEKATSSQRSEERTNLVKKKELIEKVQGLDSMEDTDEALVQLRELIAEWNTVGHVPFKDKDKIYSAFREAVDAQFDRLKVSQHDHRMQSFRNNLSGMVGDDQSKTKLYNERERLMRTYDRMKSELQTYENNIGFLNVASKGGSGLIKDLERKIENLRDEMALVVKKIDAIDENL